MAALRIRSIDPKFGYLAAPFAIAATTWVLLVVQRWAQHQGHYPYIRPFSIGFMLPIALLTVAAGRGPGFFSLILALTASAVVLSPRALHPAQYPTVTVEFAFLLVTGALMVAGMAAVHDNVRILGEAETARARLRAVMDTAPVGVLLADMSGRLVYANPEMERIWGKPLVRVGMDGWDRYPVYHADGE